MKSIKVVIAAALVTASLNGGIALAQGTPTDTCSLTNTGPSSTNICQFTDTEQVIYTCLNNILVVNGTNQTSTTGISQAENNTYVGNVSSGNAINENEFTTNANATCVAANPNPNPTPTPPAPTPTPTPPAKGGEGPAPTSRPPVVTSLPDTASNSAVKLAGLAAAGSAVAALGMTAATRAYRRHALKDLS